MVIRVQEYEILDRMRRITGDFAPLLQRIHLEVVSPEGFQARLRGKPILPGEDESEVEPPSVPVRALPASRTIIVEIERLQEMLDKEDRRLQRPLVEGMILREVIFLVTSRQPLPQPRARAEEILRRHWPFQFTALRSLGMTGSGAVSSPAQDSETGEA